MCHRLDRIGTVFCFVRRITLYVAVDAAAITAWAISNKMNDVICCMHVIHYKVSFYKRIVKHILLNQKQFID